MKDLVQERSRKQQYKKSTNNNINNNNMSNSMNSNNTKNNNIKNYMIHNNNNTYNNKPGTFNLTASCWSAGASPSILVRWTVALAGERLVREFCVAVLRIGLRNGGPHRAYMQKGWGFRQGELEAIFRILHDFSSPMRSSRV